MSHLHVLVSHSFLKPFPGQILVFNKVHRNSLRRLRQGKHSSFGRRISGRFSIYVMDLDGQLLRGRKNKKTKLDNPRHGRPIFCPFLLATTWKIFQINCLGQFFSLIPNRMTRLRLHLIHYPLPFIFFYGCHS